MANANGSKRNTNKTVANNGDVATFLSGVGNQTRRTDCAAVIALMADITGEPATMWGGSIVGFGTRHYRYESGREGDMPITGVSPRKQALTLYIMDGFEEYAKLLGVLGKHRTGSSCLYINKLADVDLSVLRSIIQQSVDAVRARAS